MTERKRQLIQPEGYLKLRSPTKVAEGQIKTINNTYYLRQIDRAETICSNKLITSTHQISSKVSPSKKLYPHQQQNVNKTCLKYQKSFTDLDNSSISIMNQHINENLSPRVYRTTRLPNQSKQFIKVNFVSKSPTGSRTSSSHIREIKPSPKKIVQYNQIITQNSQSNEFQKKVKVLEDRITRLHREKHDALAKMNEENRKAYHENTSLKLKILELQKLLQKATQKQPQVDQSDRNQDSELLLNLTNRSNCQINGLKSQIQELEVSLQAEIKKCLDLLQENEKYEKLLRQKCQLISRQQAQIQSLKSQSQQATKANQQLKTQNSNLQSEKEQYEKDLVLIKSSLTQYSDRNQTIYKEYEQKVSQLKSQYNDQQIKYEELTTQLIELQNDKIELIEIRQNLQLELNQFRSRYAINLQELKRYEGSLNQAVIKEHEIETLRNKLSSSLDCLAEANQQLLQANEEKQFQNSKIIEISNALIKYEQKYKDIEQKYCELVSKLDSDKINQTRSQVSFNDRGNCRKCEDLLKTIFRLNNHLNSTKRSS